MSSTEALAEEPVSTDSFPDAASIFGSSILYPDVSTETAREILSRTDLTTEEMRERIHTVMLFGEVIEVPPMSAAQRAIEDEINHRMFDALFALGVSEQGVGKETPLKVFLGMKRIPKCNGQKRIVPC
ncbi:MAG: hypothetical protein WCS85_04510 [Candidatus Peribacteraceae bacterium]|jgi:hypothetical protein